MDNLRHEVRENIRDERKGLADAKTKPAYPNKR
jgi:hypothetical protein